MPNTTWIGITNVSIFLLRTTLKGYCKKKDDRLVTLLRIISSFDYFPALIAACAAASLAIGTRNGEHDT